MRNLKKVLSLSLALVMLLGMMVVGAGAATYEDVAAGSDQECAIEVMSAINVFTGTEDGFAPEKTLSRAEAATIVARLVYTKATVDKMTAIGSTFADVQEKAPWAAGAIEACVNDHIVAGDGAGNFNPTGEVTGYQFGKMLLMAINYADESKYTGDNWEFNVRQDLLAAGLDEGVALSVLSNTPMKRADAAQMAFDALTYSPTGSKWAIAGLEGLTFDTVQEALLYGKILKADNLTPVKVPGNDSIAVLTYNLTVETDGEEAEDAYGRPAAAWMLNGESVYTDANKPTITLTKGYKADKLPTALKNGNYKDAESATNGADSVAMTKQSLADLTGNGRIVEVFMTGKTVTKAVVIAPELVDVLKVDTKKNTFTITGNIKIDEDSDFAALIGEVEEGDKLVCVRNGKNVLELYVPETVTGTMTFLAKDGSSATIDGEKVAPCKGYTIEAGLVKEDVIAYMINGYAAEVAEVEGEKQSGNVGDGYIWVTNIWSDNTSKYDKTQVAYVMGVLANGEVTTLQVANPSTDAMSATGDKNTVGVVANWKKLTGTPTPVAMADAAPGKILSIPASTSLAMGNDPAANTLVAGLYYYYEGQNGMKGKVLLAVPSEDNVKEVAAGNAAPAVNTSDPKISVTNDEAYFIRSDVDMVWVSGEGDDLTGNLTGREAIAAKKGYTFILDEKERAAVIFVDAGAKTSENVVYVAAKSGTASFVNADGKKDSGDKVTYYVHGSEEEETGIVKGYSDPGFYTITDNGEGYTLKAYEIAAVKAEQQLKYTNMYNGFLTIDGTDVNVRKAVIIDVRGEDDVVSTVEQLEDLVEDKSLTTVVSLIIEADNSAKAVYVVKSREAMAAPKTTLTKPASNAEPGTKTEVSVSPAQGAFQINIAEADKNVNGYKVTVKGNDGFTNPALEDWGDPDVTKGFVVFFTAGSQDGATLELTITKDGAETPTVTETASPATGAKGYVFYRDDVSTEGTYEWTITSTKTVQDQQVTTQLDTGVYVVPAAE